MADLCLVARGVICLLISLLFVGLSLACDGIDCGMGYCITGSADGYKCICVDGYDGEYCDRPTLQRRLVTEDTGNLTCDSLLCANGGTCVVEFYYEGEAPTDGSLIECDDVGNCYTCKCQQGFTGARCSEKIGKLQSKFVCTQILYEGK